MEPQPKIPENELSLRQFSNQQELEWIMSTCRAQLSEPYSIYTYNYFLTNWPELSIMCYHKQKIIGCIIGSIDTCNTRKAYIAMLVVSPQYRRAKVGKRLFDQLYTHVVNKVDKIVLQTECVNIAATKFYLKLGFFKTRCMKNYYMSGTDAFRLKLYIRETQKSEKVGQKEQESSPTKQSSVPLKKDKKNKEKERNKLNKKLEEQDLEKMKVNVLEQAQTAQQEEIQEKKEQRTL